MRIGINAVFLDPGRTGGAETYTRCLIEELQKLDVSDEFAIFAARGHEFRFSDPRFQVVECPVNPRHRNRRILWEQAYLPGILREARLDLVHFPYSSFPYRYTARSVTTIHDTMRFQLPRLVPTVERTYRRVLEERLCRLGQHVICVSQTDAETLAQGTGIGLDRITVIHHGVHVDEALWNGTAGDTDPYLLWFGRPYPHKNLETMIAAYGLLSRERSGLPRLRLVGIDAAQAAPLRAQLAEAGVASSVSLEPPLPHREILGVLKKAELLVFPSQCESFGLPVLEAKALGVPCLCSDHSVFGELHGDTVAYAKVDSPAEFAAKLDKLLSDDSYRRMLAERGRTDAGRFTWAACARETYEVYQRLVHQ